MGCMCASALSLIQDQELRNLTMNCCLDVASDVVDPMHSDHPTYRQAEFLADLAEEISSRPMESRMDDFKRIADAADLMPMNSREQALRQLALEIPSLEKDDRWEQFKRIADALARIAQVAEPFQALINMKMVIQDLPVLVEGDANDRISEIVNSLSRAARVCYRKTLR